LPGAAWTQEPLPPPEPQPPGFELTRASVGPGKAVFDAQPLPRVVYEFASPGPTDVRIELARAGKVVESWTEPGLAPFVAHTLSWDPVQDGGPQRGRLSFRVGPDGGVTRPAGSFRLRDHQFPVPGGHGYGDRFGVPRSGGRTHEGQDLWAKCGTQLVAARGGTVQAKGYSGALYGYYLTIDGTGTGRDYFYAHLASPTPLGDGDRVSTGERIGAVGKTGNASGEGCQLHFELWPSGWRQGHPIDPLRDLRSWDGWS
jgi:murein DD-endopeptidase MepM/ murein hydrolase activator NlpD